jgi:hypothetical protein
MTALDSASLHKFLVHFTDSLTPELAEHFSQLPLAIVQAALEASGKL